MARRTINDGPDDSGQAPDDGLFGWVTDFENPVAVRAANGERQWRSVAVPVAMGGSVLVAAAAVIAALLRPFEAESGMPSTDTPAVASAPSSAPSASPKAPLQLTVLPETCDGLYDETMLREFEQQGMHLNTVWTGAREATAGSASADLVQLMRGKLSLDCFWLDQSGGTESAVLTVATEPGPEMAATVAAHLTASGFAMQEHRGGVRYYSEHRVDGESVGESHFLRDGVWLATNWYGFGPWGYTAHMADNVFP